MQRRVADLSEEELEKRRASDRARYARNAEKNRERRRKYVLNNKEKVAEAKRKWWVNNRERLLEYHSQYRESNADKLRENARTRSREFTKRKQSGTMTDTDMNNHLARTLRGRLRQAIKNNYKGGSAVTSLGCSIAELKEYLETLMTSDMTWENHGTVWHIDHILPLAAFNLENSEEVDIACHFTNLQPLSCFDNISKGCST